MGERVGVVIVAAGESRRMGGIDKVLAPLLGEPLINHALRPFQLHPAVDEVVLVTSENKVQTVVSLVQEREWHKVTCVCTGGRRRQDSVRMGLEKLSGCHWIMVHDGARPCVDPYIIDRGLDAARNGGATVAAVPVKDTVKTVSSEMVVESTLKRDSLWAVQTPQVFRRELLADAHQRCEGNVTDDAAMVEKIGHQVTVFMGSYDNLKVTTPEDLTLAEAILRNRKGDGR
jgi:2-C-methyl-D-erythritol 4-phosphate cytidylyltransferase